MAFLSLLQIIKKAQSRHPQFSQRLVEAESLGRWEASVGPLISKHTRAIRVENGCIWVEVDDPIWKSELTYRKQQILEKLNQCTLAENQKPLSDLVLIDMRPQFQYSQRHQPERNQKPQPPVRPSGKISPVLPIGKPPRRG